VRNKYQRKDRKSNHKFEEAMVVGVLHFTDQIEIPSGGGQHGERIVRPARGPAPPPSAGRRGLSNPRD